MDKTKTQDKVRVAIVGAGGVASEIHIPVWKRVPTASLVGIYDIVQSKSKSIAKENGISRVFESLEDLVKDETIDLVDVCTPIHTHFSIIESALNAGKNVITEKPLASRSDEAKHLVEIAESKNSMLAVSQNHLYSNAVRKLRTRIVEGDLGELLLLTITYPISVYKPDHWTANPRTGGLLFELGMHAAYIATFIFGKAETVMAFGNEPSRDRHPGWVSAILQERERLCNIILPPLEDQPTIRAFGSKEHVTVNLFADTILYSKERMTQEYGPHIGPISVGIRSAKDWLIYSNKVAAGYFKRGMRFFIDRYRAINQFTFFNEVVSQILTANDALRIQNKQYLEVAVESIRLLERIRECLSQRQQMDS